MASVLKKLTEQDVTIIINLILDKHTYRSVAERFGVAIGTIQDHVKRHTCMVKTNHTKKEKTSKPVDVTRYDPVAEQAARSGPPSHMAKPAGKVKGYGPGGKYDADGFPLPEFANAPIVEPPDCSEPDEVEEDFTDPPSPWVPDLTPYVPGIKPE